MSFLADILKTLFAWIAGYFQAQEEARRKAAEADAEELRRAFRANIDAALYDTEQLLKRAAELGLGEPEVYSVRDTRTNPAIPQVGQDQQTDVQGGGNQ